MFVSSVLDEKKFQQNGKCLALKEGSLMCDVPHGNIASGCNLLKRNWSAFIKDYLT